jgi:hypothetical protein
MEGQYWTREQVTSARLGPNGCCSYWMKDRSCDCWEKAIVLPRGKSSDHTGPTAQTVQNDPNKLELTDPIGLLRYLVRKNEHGVWFFKEPDGNYLVLPRWIWVFCSRAIPNPLEL